MKYWLFSLFLLPSLLIAQHKISGSFSPAQEFTYAFLYQATPTEVNYINQAQVNPDGTFEIKLDASQKKGIYKIVYAVPPEENNFEVFYNGNEDIVLQFDLEKGLSFSSSKPNMLWHEYSNDISSINAEINSYYNNTSKDEAKLLKLFEELKTTQDRYEELSQATMAFPFISSNRLYIPKTAESAEVYSQNIISHYFDHIDFDNEWIQSSDYVKDRMVAYVFAMPSEKSYYISAIDSIVKAIGFNNSIKLNVLQDIWQHMVEQEFQEVANYISDTYLLKLAQDQNNTLLVETLLSFKKTAIGTKAPNFQITDHKSLYDLNQHNSYLLIFWSSTCSHCLNELPIIKTLMSKHPKMQVIAFGIEDESENWEAEIKKYPNFTHVLGLEKWDNPVVDDYGIQGTPSYFILDKNKTIIAKPDDVEKLQLYLEH